HGGRGQALDAGQVLTQPGVGDVEQVLVVAAAAGDDQVADWYGRGVVIEDGGRQHARGQVLHLTVDQRDDLRGGDVAGHLGAEVDLDDADAQQRSRLDVVEVVALGQGTLQDRRHRLLH